MRPIFVLAAALLLAAPAFAEPSGPRLRCPSDLSGPSPAAVRIEGGPFIYVARPIAASDMGSFEAWRREALVQVRETARRLDLGLAPAPALVVSDFMAPAAPGGERAPSFFSGYAIERESGQSIEGDGPATIEYLPAADALAVAVDGSEAAMVAAQDAIAATAAERGLRLGPYLIVAYAAEDDPKPVAVCRTLRP